jgi:hypothetical protein
VAWFGAGGCETHDGVPSIKLPSDVAGVNRVGLFCRDVTDVEEGVTCCIIDVKEEDADEDIDDGELDDTISCASDVEDDIGID